VSVVESACHQDWLASKRGSRSGRLCSTQRTPGRSGDKAITLALIGRRDEAISIFHKVLERDPLLIAARGNYVTSLYLTERFAEAEHEAREEIALKPRGTNPLQHPCAGLSGTGTTPRDNCHVRGYGPIANAARLYVICVLGGSVAAPSLTPPLAELESKYAGDSQSDIAYAHAFRGEEAATMDWLKRAHEAHLEDLPYWRGDPPAQRQTRVRALHYLHIEKKWHLPPLSKADERAEKRL